MTVLHHQPTLFALTSTARLMPKQQSFFKLFRLMAQGNAAWIAIKNIAYWFLLVVTFSLLTGCAGVRLIDSEVNAFSKLATVPPASTYRFERLPSQQTDVASQDQLETIAQTALDKVGLRRVGDAPGSPAARYSVQMTVLQTQNNVPGYGWWPHFGIPVVIGTSVVVGAAHTRGRYRHGLGFGFGLGYGYGYGYPYGFPYLVASPPNYLRDVALVMRDVASNTVVYETRAKHEGPWSDSMAILPAMFDAALQGFPAAPAGPRRVNVEVAR
jgi:Domain of unknown function (DUF4136)